MPEEIGHVDPGKIFLFVDGKVPLDGDEDGDILYVLNDQAEWEFCSVYVDNVRTKVLYDLQEVGEVLLVFCPGGEPVQHSRFFAEPYFSVGDSVVSSPAVSNGIVYVGSFDRYLYALDAATGAQKWRSATSDSIGSSPTVSNGIVYVGSYDGKLYAFDAVTGTQKWKASTAARIGSSPAVSNGIVYIGSFDKKLYAFDAATGAPKWSTATGGRVWSSPTVSNGTVYVGSFDKKLYAMNAATGAIKWAAATGDSIRLSSPTVLTFPGNIVLPSISGDAQ